MRLIGGNKNLQPETSTNYTFGLVFEPTTDLNVGIDFWWIQLKHQISGLDDSLIFANPAKYAGLFHRAPDGSLSIDGSQCPGANCGYVSDLTANLGGVNTNGIDINANYRLRAGDVGNFTFNLNGTYVTKYEYQTEEGSAFLQNVGVYGGGIVSGGPVFRWQHALNAAWSRGNWGLGLVNHYKSGYVDQDPSNTVASYSTWDMYGTWQPIKAISMTLGVRNMFDKAPPYSNQGATFQVGYDPRFADATGRAYYLRGTYSF